uniref:Peptidase C1A papain C-terminal domain-containing protein n=1 Tax=Solanum lycopersicum TaxID=4081 RepID=K4CI09_SOLLC
MAGDFGFSLRNEPTQILLPYIHNNRNGMHICYAYSTTEAVSALFAVDYNSTPVELSTQQIADQMPRSFNYAQQGRKRNATLGCYFGSHVDALYYARNFGLYEATTYPKRNTSWDINFPDPLPNEVKYKIGEVVRVRTENIAAKWQRVGFEDLVTDEQINQVLRHQPMVGAIRVPWISKERYIDEATVENPTDVEDGAAVRIHSEAHSVLITGWGIKNGVEYYEVKNHWGDEWGDHGYAKVRRDLVYRLAYPRGIVQLGNVVKKKKK